MVYRKLQQDVAGFNQDVLALAAKLGVDPALAGAYVVGRFKEGTPVVLSDTPTGGAARQQLSVRSGPGWCPLSVSGPNSEDQSAR